MAASDSIRVVNPPRWPVAALGFAIAAAGALVLLASGPGSRFGLWEWRTGLKLLQWGAYLGGAGAVGSLLGVIVALASGSRAGLRLGVAGMLVGLVTIGVPWSWQRKARSVPPIHDISTDTADPPAFVAILPLRADAANSAEYGGEEIARQQAEGYPDIRPLEFEVAPGAAYGRARTAAEAMGWEIVAADSAAGRIEATDRTPWFGFKDDVVVRVRPAGGGSRVDVRSVSRVGRSDVGTNARRIRDYLARLRETTE